MADLLGSLVSGIFGMGGTALSYNEQKKLAAQQNQYNIDMWKMNNEYNSPQAQMQRFRDAGLNPNLIYGQGTAGNSSAPPQQVTAQAPDWSKGMQKLADAFNIEGLRTTRAERRLMEARALDEEINAKRNERELTAEENFGTMWTYDYSSGKYVKRPVLPEGQQYVIHPSSYYFNRILEGNYNRSHLIPYRADLLRSQNSYLQPQIWMTNYERRYFPVNYWIGTGTKVMNALPTKFNFKFGSPNTMINNNSRHFTRSYEQKNFYNY